MSVIMRSITSEIKTRMIFDNNTFSLVPGFPTSMSPMSSIFHFPTLHGIPSPRQPYAAPEVHEITSRTTFDPRKNTVETPSTLNQDEGKALVAKTFSQYQPRGFHVKWNYPHTGLEQSLDLQTLDPQQ